MLQERELSAVYFCKWVVLCLTVQMNLYSSRGITGSVYNFLSYWSFSVSNSLSTLMVDLTSVSPYF